LAAAAVFSCAHPKRSPELLYEHARQAFLIGELKQCQDEAEQGYKQFRDSDPVWAWKFRILQARSALWRGLYEDVLNALDSRSRPPDQPVMAIPRLTLVGIANVYLHNFTEAETALSDAETLCRDSTADDCGDLLEARGFFASEQKHSASAEKYYELSLSFASSHNDAFLKSTSLLNLGAEALSQGRFDEAIDRSQAAHEVASAIKARAVDLVVEGNLGWAYYELGDAEKAFTLLVDAETLATQLHDVSNQENQLTNIGYIYMDQHKYGRAEESFQQALALAKSIKAKEQVYNALRVLARLALLQSDPDKASQYAEQALAIAREAGNHVDDLYPLLVQAQVAARRGDATRARQIFQTVEHDKVCPAFLKWEAEHSLARLDEDEQQADAAEREYRAALATFEAARSSVRHEDFQLSFLTNAARIYDDYVHSLVARGKTEDALRWADYSRARTLAEGLGLLTKGKDALAGPPALSPREIARRVQGALFFYWLGEKQSYLWAITPSITRLFPLPAAAEIDSLVQRYRKGLNGPEDVLSSSEDGRTLYRTLVEPAKALLARDTKVFIIPDGSLNNLNFETLVVDQPKPHYWIEDADVVNASSLRVLAASFIHEDRRQSAAERKQTPRLLLIGNSIAPSKDYPELPRAGEQMANVARHFPASQRQVYQRDQANPSAYLAGNPENFSHIHFVAHGTASRLSPLDSAIVLSKGAIEADPFKLYARDIVQHRLHAELVTISACYGAGSRAYSGEGLVGLAWAFLRAGAHNVIASLWEVTDASTEQLMDRFYDELDKGASPDAALRAAKLSLLHGSAFRNPFYWAPFQLYTGS
jgi:CHAT domain-containing protein